MPGELSFPFSIPPCHKPTEAAELAGDICDGCRVMVALDLEGIGIPIVRRGLGQLVYRRTDRRTRDGAVVFACQRASEPSP